MSPMFTNRVAAIALFAMVSCSKAGPAGEAQQGTPSSPTRPATEQTGQTPGQTIDQATTPGSGTGGQAMTQAAQSATIDIYGIPLGAPYADAVKAASAQFQLQPDGSDYHRGTGTIDGMKATLTMEGKQGRLVDIQLRLVLDAPDHALDGSKPLTRLQAALGKPADKSADLATWKPAGFEVALQRQRTHARDRGGAKVQYTIRARALPVPAGGQPDPDEQSAKELEAGQGTP